MPRFGRRGGAPRKDNVQKLLTLSRIDYCARIAGSGRDQKAKLQWLMTYIRRCNALVNKIAEEQGYEVRVDPSGHPAWGLVLQLRKEINDGF